MSTRPKKTTPNGVVFCFDNFFFMHGAATFGGRRLARPVCIGSRRLYRRNRARLSGAVPKNRFAARQDLQSAFLRSDFSRLSGGFFHEHGLYTQRIFYL